jgi:signal transduction histidine kinase
MRLQIRSNRFIIWLACAGETAREKERHPPVNSRLDAFKWLATMGSVLLAAFLLFVAYFQPLGFLPPALAYALLLLVVAVIALVFFRFFFDALAQRQRELAALQHIAETVSASLDRDAILARALDAVFELTHAAAGRVWLVDADSGDLKNAVHRGLFPDAFAEPTTLKRGDGLAGRVAQSARAEIDTDLSRASNAALLREKGFAELISVPLVARGSVVGIMDIASRERGELGAATRDLLTVMGRQIGLVIENARLFEAARARQTDAENLYKAGMDLSSNLDLAQVLNLVAERGCALLDVDASALCLWDNQNRWLVVGSQSGPAEAFESQARVGRRIAQRIGQLRVDALHPREDSVACALIRAPFRRTHMEMPLRVGNQVIGCLCVSSARSRAFTDRDAQVLGGLANQAAIAIQNARAYDHAGNVAISMERERLAREMHDTLAQVLGFVSTKAQALRELIDAGRIDLAREQIDHLIELSQELYADVREVILGLRAAISPEKNLLPTLGEYIQQFSRQSGVETELIVEDGASGLTFAPAVELQLIRIVQESLTNVRKHARAQHAVVRLSTIDGHAEMRVEDDGVGFDPSRIARGDFPQLGLQTMRERAESVGGAFVVVSKPNVGTQIVVQIPLRYTGGR